MARQCTHCNQPIGDQDAFCSHCGSSNPVQPTQQPTYQQPIYQPSVYQQPTYQQPTYQQSTYQQSTYQQTAYPQPVYQPQNYQRPSHQQPNFQQLPTRQSNDQLNSYPELPLKWFKFIIYFQLFLTCISSLSSALQVFTGALYDGYADYLYSQYPIMRTIDSCYGFANICVAVSAIYVRFQLAGFRKNGPNLYIGFLAGTLGLTLIYTIFITVADAPYDVPSAWSSLASFGLGRIAMLVCNTIYFKNRKHLFNK